MPSEVARQFGANLAKARRRAGLSQEEVGSLASLHRTEVGLLERGARVPRVDTLVKLAAALGIRIDCELLAGINWIPGSTQAGAFASACGETEKVGAALTALRHRLLCRVGRQATPGLISQSEVLRPGLTQPRYAVGCPRTASRTLRWIRVLTGLRPSGLRGHLWLLPVPIVGSGEAIVLPSFPG